MTTIRELDDRGVSISRVEEVLGWLGHSRVAGGETLPDRGWNQDPQPTDAEDRA